jgi:hypothetical protein
MNVKGTALAVLPIFIESKFGKEGLNKWLESLNTEAVALYQEANTIKLNQWYPLKESYLEPTAALCELFYDNDPKGAWEVGRFSADYALKGVYKAFVKMTSVSFFIKRASLLMTTYYQPSTMELKSSTYSQAVLHMTEFPEAHHLIESRIGGWIQRSLEIHGCKEVAVETTKALADDDPHTEFILSWK